MSPSTKNLKERIEEIVMKENGLHQGTCEQMNQPYSKGLCDCDAVSIIASLLSSELSLAVKGLREGMKPRDRRCEHKRKEDSKDCLYCHYFDGFDEALERFDSKAKEILGESSYYSRRLKGNGYETLY